MPAKQSQTLALGANKNASGQDIYKSIKTDLNQKISESEFFPISQNFVFKADNWNKLLPYRLIILKASEGKNKTPLNTGSPADNTEYSIISSIYATPGAGSVQPIFTLPIAPQNLSIDMPFANQTTVLSDGILVENNGAPLRIISIQGTTGVAPFRALGAESYSSSIAGELVGNTVRTATAIGRSAKNIKSSIASIGGIGGADTAELDNTGYAQFHKLKDFLDLWANLSKRPGNKNLRLALDLGKDDTTYLITPKRFTMQRGADSPMEYRYTLQVEAWKRIKINGGNKDSIDKALSQGVFENIGKVQQVIQALQSIRKIIQQIAQIGNAIRADFAKIVNIVRECILIAKDIAGVAKTILDLPGDLIRAARGPILSAVADVQAAWKAVENNFNQFPKNFSNALNGELNQGNADSQGIQTASPALSTLDQSGSLGTKQIDASPARPGPAAGSVNKVASSTPLLDKIISNPLFGGPLLDVIPLDLLNIPSNLQDTIQLEIDRVRNYKRHDFVLMKSFTEKFSRDCAVYFGLGDRTTDASLRYYSVDYPSSTRKPSRKEMDLLNALRSLVRVLDDFTTFEIAGDNSINKSFNFIGNIANSANINTQESIGKVAVPVIFDKTLEEIATYYLGSPERSAEIALLNGLASPFIDEDGTYQNFLSNASKNSFSISNGLQFYIGQKLIFSSNLVVSFSRYITDIKRLNNTHYLITVDGEDNLDTLQLADEAKVQYFAPGTVSSRDTIYIPSNEVPSNIPQRLRPLPYYFKDVDNLASFTGVDIAIGSNNDVILSKSGKVVLVGGLSNLQQALKLKFITPKGSLVRHPGYGSGIQPGMSIADISAADIKDQAISSIMSDFRFGEVQFISVELSGPIMRINGGVTVNANNTVLPFAFRVSP